MLLDGDSFCEILLFTSLYAVNAIVYVGSGTKLSHAWEHVILNTSVKQDDEGLTLKMMPRNDDKLRSLA